MLQALFFHDIINPNPDWWPLLYPADILIGYFISRMFAAKIMVAGGDTEFDRMTSDDRFITAAVSIIGGVFWIPGLAVFGAIRAFNWVPETWERSVDAKAQRIIARRKKAEEKPKLGSLKQKEIA